jgi:endonuclease YncB( thermonuclease family)
MIWTVPATVLEVHDGDTLKVNADLGWHITLINQPVRLAGVDAPELATDAGKAAAAFTAALAPPGTMVTLVSHSLDKYGRVLGTITLPDGQDLSAALIAAGHGVDYHGGKRG